MKHPLVIVGAGLAGMLAAEAFPEATILEAAQQDAIIPHRALLRFRGPEVGAFLRIPFRRVSVLKGVWTQSRGISNEATITDINHYSLKTQRVLLSNRSIARLEPVDRWVAPPDLYPRLLERNGRRIAWGAQYSFVEKARSKELYLVISTAPLPKVAAGCGLLQGENQFKHASITVRRVKIEGASTHQTIYFPDLDLSVYRASITDDTLIAEFIREPQPEDFSAILGAFGLDSITSFPPIESTRHSFGKIAPVADDAWRRSLIHELTTRFGVYSLGRYATWRNILLDDVLRDIEVVRSMINGDDYFRGLRSAAAT
jgi:hypothetical protein